MGFLVYHRNRLIKCMGEPYSSPSSIGRGVIGAPSGVRLVASARPVGWMARTGCVPSRPVAWHQGALALWRRLAPEGCHCARLCRHAGRRATECGRCSRGSGVLEVDFVQPAHDKQVPTLMEADEPEWPSMKAHAPSISCA